MTYAIKDISSLPSIEEIMKTSQGLALLEAVIMPNWEYRYFSFNVNWDGNNNEMLASMRDGQGNEYFLHFTKDGLIGKVLFQDVFDFNSNIENIPNNFESFKNESAFNVANSTFFFWRLKDDNFWSVEPKNINKLPLLSFISKGFSEYINWYKTYYDCNLDENIMNEIYNNLAINKRQLDILNSSLSLDDLKHDIKEILG